MYSNHSFYKDMTFIVSITFIVSTRMIHLLTYLSMCKEIHIQELEGLM